jgi:hypothetical protein
MKKEEQALIMAFRLLSAEDKDKLKSVAMDMLSEAQEKSE